MKPRRILLIEDDGDVRDALVDVLEEAGFDVVCAQDGGQGLVALRRGLAPCVVLLDMRMPTMDGAEFLREQLGDPGIADVPVVLLSADTRLDQTWRNLGASGCLRKPVHLETLLDVVERYCRPLPVGHAPA